MFLLCNYKKYCIYICSYIVINEFYHAVCQVGSDTWNDRFQQKNSDSEESTTPNYLDESSCKSDAGDETKSQTASEEIEGTT